MLMFSFFFFFFCRFQCVQMPNKVLESISIIDTPGILTAAKRKLSRGETEYHSDFLFNVRTEKKSLCFQFFTLRPQVEKALLLSGRLKFLVREESQ